jgi:capsular polysaccharide biosynthesis protein
MALIFAIIGTVYTFGFVTPKYKSSTTLVLTKASTEDVVGTESTNSITTTDVTLNSKLVSTYSEIVKSQTVIRQVISNLGIAELNENSVRKSVSVSAVEDAEIIEITVSNENAVYASKIANEIAKVFTEQVSELYNINNVHILDEAEVAQGPYNINHLKDIVIFMLVGLIIAVGYILVAYMLDTTVKSSDDIEKNAELPTLASIPVYNYEEGKGGKKRK